MFAKNNKSITQRQLRFIFFLRGETVCCAPWVHILAPCRPSGSTGEVHLYRSHLPRIPPKKRGGRKNAGPRGRFIVRRLTNSLKEGVKKHRDRWGGGLSGLCLREQSRPDMITRGRGLWKEEGGRAKGATAARSQAPSPKGGPRAD